MTRDELKEIKRRRDGNQGIHISHWNKQMWVETIRDMNALIREVEVCWKDMEACWEDIAKMDEKEPSSGL